MGDVIWPGQFGAHQLALPLSKYLPASFFARFASGLVAGASYDGQVYGAPFFQDQGFLYYRTDLLKAAGMAVPKTWEQLESDAATLVKAGQGQVRLRLRGQLLRGRHLRLHGVLRRHRRPGAQLHGHRLRASTSPT